MSWNWINITHTDEWWRWDILKWDNGINIQDLWTQSNVGDTLDLVEKSECMWSDLASLVTCLTGDKSNLEYKSAKSALECAKLLISWDNVYFYNNFKENTILPEYKPDYILEWEKGTFEELNKTGWYAWWKIIHDSMFGDEYVYEFLIWEETEEFTVLNEDWEVREVGRKTLEKEDYEIEFESWWFYPHLAPLIKDCVEISRDWDITLISGKESIIEQRLAHVLSEEDRIKGNK